MTADSMQRAREMLIEAYSADTMGLSLEQEAMLQGIEPALRAIAIAINEADIWKQKADFWQACAFEGDKQATEAEKKLAHQDDGWRPIETAPDTDELILVAGGRHRRADIVASDAVWWRMKRKAGSKAIPTHWRPLPPAPEMGR